MPKSITRIPASGGPTTIAHLRRARCILCRFRKPSGPNRAPAGFVLLDDPIDAGLRIAPTIARREYRFRRNSGLAQRANQIGAGCAMRRTSFNKSIFP